MTEIEKLIADAASRDRELEALDAKAFLAAQKILARDPDNTAANRVLSDFSSFMATGQWPLYQGGRSFASFIVLGQEESSHAHDV